ncbi:MAG: hypothetical protein E6R04_04840 [Spirochaetes bacterium]|nr:MAG: hypothetical protein E6R04_04840 [Spirochaetota bacterium]
MSDPLQLRLTPYDYQVKGIEFALAKRYSIIGDQMGCISGDAVVIVNRAGCARRMSLRDLYRKFHSDSWRKDIPTRMSSINERGILSLNVVRDVLAKGTKPVLRVSAEREDGTQYSVVCTPDHEISTPAGWVRADQLEVGGEVLTNGIKYCGICKTETTHSTYKYSKFFGECRPCIYRKRSDSRRGGRPDGDGYVRVGRGTTFHPRRTTGGVYEHILVYEAYQNELPLADYLERLSRNDLQGLWFVPKTHAIHHKNGNKVDNRLENLEMLTHSDHQREHAPIDHIKGMKVAPARVTSIAPDGDIDVYDIVMSDPHRNFIADGVVVHNCGKSLQALGLAAAARAENVLVVCPAFLVFNWRAEIEKFLGKEAQDAFTVVSYDNLRKIGTMKGYDVVIADEAHYVKNLEAQRTLAFHTMIARDPPEFFVGLSGTPIKNAVPEWYSLLKLCWYGGGYPEFQMYSGGPYGFLTKFTHRRQFDVNGRTITKYEGLRNPEQLRALIKPVYIRRKTADVLTLPERVTREVLISESADFDAQMEAVWEDYAGGKNKNLFASTKAVSALAKVKFTVEFVRELLSEVDRVIVFTDHRQAAEEIRASWQVGEAAMIRGDTPMVERAAIVERFEAGRIKVLVATIGAMSVGVNLTSANVMVFNDFPWVPADMAQAEGRIHRIGQRRVCQYVYILASRQDQVIYRTLEAKKKLIEKVGV